MRYLVVFHFFSFFQLGAQSVFTQTKVKHHFTMIGFMVQRQTVVKI